MEITYYGHACFGAKVSGKNVLFDPFVSSNELARHIDVNKIPADYILISHAHGDHLEDAVKIGKRTNAIVAGSFEIATWAEKNGLKSHPMNHGGSKHFDFGTVKLTSAIHSSSFPDGTYGGNPYGFLVTSAEGNFYYSGDTALTMDMQLVPRWAKLDCALLPIGDNFTMGVEDAVIAAAFIRCKKIIALHYDTFGYIKIDGKEAKAKFLKEGIDLIMLKIGETIKI